MGRSRGGDAPHEHIFINDNRTNARRISDKTWEDLRPIIIEQYGEKTLDDVIEYMAINHAFTPTSVEKPCD